MKSEYYILGLQVKEGTLCFFEYDGSPTNTLERAFRYSDIKVAKESRDIIDKGITQRYNRYLDQLQTDPVTPVFNNYQLAVFSAVATGEISVMRVTTTVEELKSDNSSEPS